MSAPRLVVHAIDPGRLTRIRRDGTDGHGNRLQSFPACGEGEPLRCCLCNAEAGEAIALMSYAPFDRPSVWTEVGPVYVHALPCAGYDASDRLPPDLSTGPRVLRTYRADRTMNYEHNTVVTEPVALGPILLRLLREPGVDLVHVRTLAPQCFLYAVTGS